MSDFKVIENNKEGRDSFGYLYGCERKELTHDDIHALLNGKCLATDVNDEYVIFVTLEGK